MIYPLIEAENQVLLIIKKILSESNIEMTKDSFQNLIEIPPENMGDFAFPCFFLSKRLKKSPNEIAKDLSEKIKKEITKNKWIEKIELKGAYINLYLKKEHLKSKVLDSLFEKKEKYGFLDNKKKKVIVEHTSANPNGPLHVGRARNPIIGDTIVRIFKAAGYNVESQFYLDDMGKQVAILAWGINNIDLKKIPKSEYDKPDHKTVGFYQEASKMMKEDNKVTKEISRIVKLAEEGDSKEIKNIHKAYSPVLKGINESLKRINIEIDNYIPESNFVNDRSVDFVVTELKKTKYCDFEDGAYFLDLESFGIQGRNTKFFFVRKDGTTLYATRDIAYHLWKIKNADLLVNILGEDHKLESKQVEIALNLVNAKITPKVVFYSFVSLPGGKMSTRKARVVYLDELIDECVLRACNEVKKRRGGELTDKQMKKIAEIIGIGALRYNIIKVQPEKDIVFKWEEALNFEGNSSPFIQYAHARACSILEKNKEKIGDIDSKILVHNSEYYLIKKLAEFPLVINESCKNYKPHLIANYLYEIASCFNQFYRDCPVLIERDTKIKNSRLNLVDFTRIVLKNGLDLLGIIAPEEM